MDSSLAAYIGKFLNLEVKKTHTRAMSEEQTDYRH